MENSGNIPIFNIPEHYLEIFPGISQGTFSEYSGNIYHGIVPRIFHEHVFARWVLFNHQTYYPRKTRILFILL